MPCGKAPEVRRLAKLQLMSTRQVLSASRLLAAGQTDGTQRDMALMRPGS
jgi:hypothetical protein